MRLAWIALLTALGGAPQDKDGARGGIELRWNLPHDRAAIYDVYDARTRKKRGEFWLLGCDITGRVGATDTNELPYRYIFRLPKEKVKVRGSWKVREKAFGDLPVIHPGISPLEVVGAYRLRQVKKASIKDFFKVAAKEREDKTDQVNVAVIEGGFQVFRCNWRNRKVEPAEKKPSATLVTLTVVRLSDGAILGGRSKWRGRTETYSNLSGPAAKRGDEIIECLLREPLVELDRKALKGRIDKAVENGVKWLKAQYKGGRISDAGGYPVGTVAGAGATSLSILALMHSGVAVGNVVVRSSLSYLAGLGLKLSQVYDLGIYLTALEGKYIPMGMLEDVEAFSEDKTREEIARKITKKDKAAAEAAARLLIERQAKNGAFGYNDPGYPNLSSLQYALLGLKSASRMGVSIPTSVWTKALSYLKSAAVMYGEEPVSLVRRGGKSEEKKVYMYGWGYLEPRYREPTGTMVLAALAVIAVCRSELERKGEWSEARERKVGGWELGGLAWFQKYYSVRAGTPEGCMYGAAMVYYYLYGLERAMILLGVDRIGGHNWYLEGAALLLSWQRPDGSWMGPHGTSVIDTAWALLFLKRATVPVMTPTGSKKKP